MSRTQSLFNVLSVVTVVALWVIPETSLGRAAPAPGGHHPIFFGGDNTPGYPLLNTSGVGEPQVSGPSRLQVTIAPISP